MTLAPKPDNAAVRAYRDEHQCSLFEAKTVLLKKWRREQLDQIRDLSLYGETGLAYAFRDLIDLLSEDLK